VADASVGTVIVGASAAGLATACCLRRAGVPFVLLEREPQIASAWRHRYDRLHLHTSKGFSALPYLRFPRSTPRYPSRDEVVSYLEAYAARFSLAPQFGETVRSVRPQDGGWLTETSAGSYQSRHVVVATGYAREPERPRWPGLEEFGGPVLHSAEYRNGSAWAGKRVLVVGLGNSGGELAIDLCEHGARPSIAVRSALNMIPRDFLGLPILAWAWLLDRLPARIADAIARAASWLSLGSIERLGLRKLPYGPLVQIRQHGRIPLIDVGTVARIRRREIEILPDVRSFSAGRATFSDGAERPFDAVVLATGFRPALTFLAPDLVAPTGFPRASGQEVAPGLYFCGFYLSPTGMLREIAHEAKRIAHSIARAPLR
jgi:indole-3-pyruvate monooxygenase